MANPRIIIDRDIRYPTVTMGQMYSPDGDFGLKLQNGRTGLYTIELPWKDNQPKISCIPPGIYLAERDIFYGGDGPGGKKDYPCFEVRNVLGRTEIKFHIANYLKDIVGCIGPGMARDPAHPAVWSSTQAFGLFMDFLKGVDAFDLDIRSV